MASSGYVPQWFKATKIFYLYYPSPETPNTYANFSPLCSKLPIHRIKNKRVCKLHIKNYILKKKNFIKVTKYPCNSARLSQFSLS